MKTKKNPRINFNPGYVFIVLILSFQVNGTALHAQGLSNSPDDGLSLNPVTVVESSLSGRSEDSTRMETANGQNKKAFGHNVQMIFSILREPFISKKSRKEGPYDVIIVPGIPYNVEKGAGLIMKARIKWAYYLVSNGIAKNVIFSGSAVYTPYTESRIMGIYLEKMGIPAENIIFETKAEHSTENVVYSLRMADKLGFKKIAIATGPFQSAFLDKYVKAHSLKVSFIAIPLLYNGNVGPEAFSGIDPSPAFVEDFVSLTERESKEERHQGTLGNKIED
jgi:hypothetical protein